MAEQSANPAYADAQLARALRTVAEHPDPAVRERARARLAAWEKVVEGMASGALHIGSRAPVANTPTWATLEVVTGGFATGRLCAEEDLDEHEHALLARLSPPEADETPRGRLNRHALGPEGQAALVEQVRSGRFRLRFPEHGALAVVAWLNAHGRADEALAIVEAIGPWLNRLRFTPDPAEEPLRVGTSVRRESVMHVRHALSVAGEQEHVRAMNETLRVWNPLTDRVVALFLETVDGEAPRLARDEAGALSRRPDGQPIVEGGRPLSRLPPGWMGLLAEWLEDLDEALATHTLCKKARDPRHLLARFARIARRVAEDPEPLPPEELGALRGALAGFLSRHGQPGSERLARVRAEQARVAALPTRAALRGLLRARLAPREPLDAIESLDILRRPVGPEEASYAPVGTEIPADLVRRGAYCLEAPIEELIALGLVPSAEVLALLLPQITAAVRGTALQDPALRGLYAAIYSAFRRRRGLLLLSLEHQVKAEELPWLAPLRVESTPDTVVEARAVLQQVCATAFTGFPHQILPNLLIRELVALAETAEIKLPLTEELAADIFTGSFTRKFEQAALIAAGLLQGTLYAHYYDLPGPGAFAGTGRAVRWGKVTAEDFAALCEARADESRVGKGSFVADHGAVIEQAQILGTHNLAALFNALGLRAVLAPDALARDCFRWILRRNEQMPRSWRKKLKLAKQSAYAWRQMLFFASVGTGQAALAPDLRAALARAHPQVQARLEPALVGLERVSAGARFDAEGKLGEGRRLLGWVVGPHWFLQ